MPDVLVLKSYLGALPPVFYPKISGYPVMTNLKMVMVLPAGVT